MLEKLEKTNITYLDKGIHKLNNIEIDEDIRVVGQNNKNTIIDAGGEPLAIVNKDVEFELNHVKIINAVSDKGGAIHNKGHSVFKNVIFEDNRSEGSSAKGGAIYNENCLICTGCEFIKNTSENEGGAIYNDDIVKMTSTHFRHNISEENGGAIYNNDVMAIHTSTINYNITNNLGGGLYNSSTGDVNIFLSSFVGNIALKESGAIHSDNNAKIEYSRIIDNEKIALSGKVNARYNWWGYNNGPNHRVNDGVSVEPWLVVDIDVTTLPGGEVLASGGLRKDNHGREHPLIMEMDNLGVCNNIAPCIYSKDAVNNEIYPHSTELFYPKKDILTINYQLDKELITKKINIEGK